MKKSEIKITVDDTSKTTSAIHYSNAASTHLLILAHGAGTDMRHSFMDGLSQALLNCNVATLRFNFMYKELGKFRPDRKPVAVATIAAVVSWARKEIDLPSSLGGKSFGGRMMSHYIAENPGSRAQNLILYGFPLHPAGKPATDRADHLSNISIPMLFLQGDRDALATIDLIEPVLGKLPTANLDVLPGANHGFKFLKKYQINEDAAFELLAKKTAEFIAKQKRSLKI